MGKGYGYNGSYNDRYRCVYRYRYRYGNYSGYYGYSNYGRTTQNIVVHVRCTHRIERLFLACRVLTLPGIH